MSEIRLSAPERMMRALVQRYNHEKYWRYRAIVVDPNQGSKLGDLFRLWYIKRADAFNNASMGTHRNMGARFATPPQLPHGLNGIVVTHHAVIGRNCRIYQQVTIGETAKGSPILGDDVIAGAGAKIIGPVTIGNGVRIGAGCVITQDIPDGAIVTAVTPTIIIKKQGE